jgi:N-acetylmuramoyl-L-alanine amidase
MIISTALLCLAANIYYEARGEMIPGQYAVALVTVNRAEGDHSQVCAEVFRPKQFSWTIGTTSVTRHGWRILPPKDQQAWELAIRIAKHTLAGRMPDMTRGATHYHATYVTPDWSFTLKRTARFGRHIFYSQV